MTPRVFFSRCGALVALLSCLCLAIAAQAVPCIVADNGFGTADLPPGGCEYITPTGDMHIVDGLPPATTMEIDSILRAFLNAVELPGGGLGGNVQQYEATLDMPIIGTGGLAGFNRPDIAVQVQVQTVSAPRMLGSAVQSFATEMMQMQGQITGDPDFDLLRITAGTSFGLPSPGHTTLTRQGPPGSNWSVDSFFDITYRIDFVGHPGSPLAGRSGSTTGTIRMSVGDGTVPEPSSFVLVGLAVCGFGAAALRLRNSK